MSAIDGLSHEEVAARLDTTVETTRSLLARARENLRRTAAARETACGSVRSRWRRRPRRACAPRDRAPAPVVVRGLPLVPARPARPPSRLRRLASWSPWALVAQLLSGGGKAAVGVVLRAGRRRRGGHRAGRRARAPRDRRRLPRREPRSRPATSSPARRAGPPSRAVTPVATRDPARLRVRPPDPGGVRDGAAGEGARRRAVLPASGPTASRSVSSTRRFRAIMRPQANRRRAAPRASWRWSVRTAQRRRAAAAHPRAAPPPGRAVRPPRPAAGRRRDARAAVPVRPRSPRRRRRARRPQCARQHRSRRPPRPWPRHARRPERRRRRSPRPSRPRPRRRLRSATHGDRLGVAHRDDDALTRPARRPPVAAPPSRRGAPALVGAAPLARAATPRRAPSFPARGEHATARADQPLGDRPRLLRRLRRRRAARPRPRRSSARSASVPGAGREDCAATGLQSTRGPSPRRSTTT